MSSIGTTRKATNFPKGFTKKQQRIIIRRSLVFFAATVIILGFIPIFNFIFGSFIEEPKIEESSSFNTTMAEYAIGNDTLFRSVRNSTNEEIPIYEIGLSTELQQFNYELSEKYPHLSNLDGDSGYHLLLATGFIESNYDFNAISSTNDYGAYQINQINHQFLADDYGLTNMLDPYQNTEAAAIILNNCIAAWEGEELSHEELLLAVANSYNMGVGGYQSYRNGGSHYERAYGRQILAGIEMLAENETINDSIRE